MKFYIETHVYAPELNTVHFVKGGSIRAAGVTTIRQARETLFKPIKSALIVTVLKEYEAGTIFAGCNDVRCARVEKLRNVIPSFVALKKHWLTSVGKPLFDGGVMPKPKLKITLRLVG